MSEVPARLRDKQPLLASQLDFTTPKAPKLEHDAAAAKELKQALHAMRALCDKVASSPRAQKDLAGRKHAVAVKTAGGEFAIHVDKGQLRIDERMPKHPEFTMVAKDLSVFTRWVADGSLTDAAVEGNLWLPNKEAFALLPILDRLPRSVRRDAKR